MLERSCCRSCSTSWKRTLARCWRNHRGIQQKYAQLLFWLAAGSQRGAAVGAGARAKGARWASAVKCIEIGSILLCFLQDAGEKLPSELQHELKAHDGPVLAVRFNRAGTYCLSAGRVR